MQVTQKNYTTLLLGCLAISMFAFSGCRAGGFAKPDLAKLAFWKKENSLLASKDTPPPPARHFDPAPINGEKKSQGEVVDLDGEQLRSRYKNDISEMRAEIEDAVKGLAKKPIREPYGSETDKGENGITSDNSFAAKPINVKSKLDGLTKSADTALNAVQNDFQAAMSNVSQKVNNDFAANMVAAKDMTTGWKEDIALPKALLQPKNTIDQSLAATKKSLSDANGKLAADLKSEAANSFEKVSNAFGGDTNSFGQTAPPTNLEIQKAQAEVREAKRQIEELKQQVAMATRQSATAPAASPSTTWPAQQNFAPTTMQSPDRLAQLQDPAFNPSPATSAAGTDPANVLRSFNQPLLPQTTQPLVPQINQAPRYATTPHGGFAPRASDNDFGPDISTHPAATGSQVGFQSANDVSAVVTADNAPESATGFDAKVQSHVSDIDIPDSVLKRTGSYAPGSVEALQSGN